MNNEFHQYRKNYTEIYRERVVPALKHFEQERISLQKKANKKSFYTRILVAVTSFFLMIAIKTHIFTALWYSVLLGLIWGSVVKRHFKKEFELKIKKRIMPTLMTAFGNMKWGSAYGISIDEIKKSKLYDLVMGIENDDCFFTSYKGIPIRISETRIFSLATYSAFSGVFILIDIPKKFSGYTHIKERTYKYKGPYKEVKLEDVEFSEEFYVGSTDQVEARYLLTPAFMQRYKNIQKAFNGSEIECSFYGNKLLIAVSSGDSFSLGDLGKTVIDIEQFTTMLNEIISIYEMVEELKLYQNIGM